MEPRDMPRLLIVADTLLGGLGAVVRRQAEWFAAHEWSVTLAAPRDGTVPKVRPRVDYQPIPVPATIRHAPQAVRAARALKGLHGRVQPHVVHVHGMRSMVVAEMAAVRRPFVTMHGFGPVPSDPPLYHALRRVGTDVIPRMAAEASTAEPGWGPGWVHRVFASPLLTDLDRLPFPAPDSTPIVAWVGLLDERKRPEMFVHAVAAVSARGVPIRGVMAGSGPRTAEIVGLIRRTHAPIEMLGETDPVPVLRRAWMVALFSRFEAMAMAVQEAMWAGRPIVASDLPAIAHLAGDTGTFVDSVDDAAAAITALCDHAVAVREGERAAARVRQVVPPDSPWPEFDAAFRRLARLPSAPRP